MNFITFSTASTNIFPAANDTSGAQLVTEWNIRARETIATDPEVTYPIGPSYVHNMSDFEVGILTDAGGAFVNNYTLTISPGRGVINGHYVESLIPMTIDLVEANAKLAAQARPVLKGELAIGIRTFYSTDQTVAGSILVANDEDMYLGVQMVILPEEELITPSLSPTDQSKVTADIKLATFTYLNNTISALQNLSSKIQFLNSSRVADLDAIVSEKYVTKYGLNPKKIYAFGGKGTNPSEGYDTWEDVTDSLMVWDAQPQRTTTEPTYLEAEFVASADKNYLVMPHKQVTGMTDDNGNPEYYAPKILTLPTASYATNTPGVVNAEYTRQIKEISSKVDTFRSTLTGKQIYYMELRTETDELPQINDVWSIGDYILVGSDEAYTGGTSDTESAPSTMYVVLPGDVETIQFITQVDGSAAEPAPIPSNITGVELVGLEWYEEAGQDPPDTEYPEYYPQFFAAGDQIRGVPGDATTNVWVDYFKIRYYRDEEGEASETYPYTDYYYGVLTATNRQWSDAVLVTGSVAFATEDIIGGFLDASSDAVDYGYVHLDETGHLRLIDYELLRSGTLAYQLAADLTIPAGSDISVIQDYLDEYVNERVAFPTQTVLADTPSILHVYLTINESEEGGGLQIHGIDSRFNTAVCLHVQGDCSSNVSITIRDCEKFIIDSDIQGTPIINVMRTCLFYDPVVFQYIRTCERDTEVYGNFTGFRDLSLWYAQRDTDDPPLVVDGMTVSELDAQIIATEIDYWKELGTAANDNNYLVALKSITFSGTGDIVGCTVLTANNSTDNVDPGDKIVVGEFTLPQGSSLIYPTACLTRVLKVSGEFTSAYCSENYWYVTNNSFSLETGVFDPYSIANTMKGTIAFHSVTTLVPSTITQTSISPWEPDTYHVFSGGAIS